MHARRLVLATAAVCTAAVVSATATVVAAGPSGDPATIALYRSAAATTDARGAVVISQSGYMTVTVRPGAPATFSWTYGRGSVPAGSRAADETLTLAQAKGKVVWLTDYVAAAPCTVAQPCATTTKMPPVELLVTPHAAFAGVVTGPHAEVACFRRVPFTAVPYRAGVAWWSAFGEFRPKVTRGNQILVTVTYAWGDGRHVVERDSIGAAARLFSGSALHVAAGTYPPTPAFSVSQRDAYPTVVPAAPRVALCT